MIEAGELISKPYQGMQRQLHATRPYGERGKKWAKAVVAAMRMYGATSILDYGCGQGTLKEGFQKRYNRPGIRFDEYDPGIIGKERLPDFADLVVCTDVLEHIEPDRLNAVLAHLRMLARKAVFVVVAIVPSANILEDGRNAHLIIEPARWWKIQFRQAGFTTNKPPVVARRKRTHELTMLLEP